METTTYTSSSTAATSGPIGAIRKGLELSEKNNQWENSADVLN